MQGQRTRDQILEILSDQDGLSREELCDRGLTYAQVRRQTKTLVSDGKVRSSTGTNGRRYYFLIFPVALVLACSVPMSETYFENSYGLGNNQRDRFARYFFRLDTTT